MGLTHQRAWAKVQVGTRVLGPRQLTQAAQQTHTRWAWHRQEGGSQLPGDGIQGSLGGYRRSSTKHPPLAAASSLLVPSMGLGPGPGRYCNQSHDQEKTPGQTWSKPSDQKGRRAQSCWEAACLC